MEFRSASAADVDAVLALWHQAEAVPTTTDDADGVRALLAFDPDALVLAVDDAGAITGSVIAGWDGWRGSVYRLAVSPEARRAGLATQLVAEAVRRLQQKGARRLAAIVDADSPDAVAFWDRAPGWSRQQQRYRYVRNASQA
jgi:ribosomal protein S18 acetylase RimI-like enzyme